MSARRDVVNQALKEFRELSDKQAQIIEKLQHTLGFLGSARRKPIAIAVGKFKQLGLGSELRGLENLPLSSEVLPGTYDVAVFVYRKEETPS